MILQILHSSDMHISQLSFIWQAWSYYCTLFSGFCFAISPTLVQKKPLKHLVLWVMMVCALLCLRLIALYLVHTCSINNLMVTSYSKVPYWCLRVNIISDRKRLTTSRFQFQLKIRNNEVDQTARMHQIVLEFQERSKLSITLSFISIDLTKCVACVPNFCTPTVKSADKVFNKVSYS